VYHRAGPVQTVGDSTLGAGGTDRDDTLDQGPPQLADVRAMLRAADGIVAGRYELREVLGAGAMGVVLGARDRLLDRVVALKILRRESTMAEVHERLVREARALAQIAHPNVIGVFDVGRVGARTYVAMELVEGFDLRRWMAQQSDRRARVEAFVQAGLGLAAAHAVGVVHRDFKPENVMIGRDGRVRVADFGLAHSVSRESAPTDEPAPSRFHALVGTPTYMAPEQFLGLPASPQTDQFSFFVALYETLHDRRPFAGNTVYELAAALLQGGPQVPDRSRGLARRLWPILQRGLARDATNRFPDMSAAIGAIEHALRPRRRWRVTAFIGAAIAAATFAAWPSPAPGLCERLQERRREVWNDDVRARLHAGLLGSGVSFAEATSTTTMREIDEWVAAWDREQAFVCEVHEVDTRHDCLGGALAQLAATTHALGDASVADMRRAVAAIGALPRPDRCRAAPVAIADADLRERFAAFEAAFELGHNGEAARLARELVEIADERGDAVGSARARLGLGRVLEDLQDADSAHDELGAAFFAALGVGDEVTAVQAATALAHLETFGRAGYDDAESWIRHARAHLREDDVDGSFDTELAAAHLDHARGRYDEACAAFERTLAATDLSPSRRASLHYDLGFTRHLQGREPEAAAHLEQSHTLFEQELGATHPEVGDVLLVQSEIATSTGDLERARTLAEQGLAIVEDAHGPDHTDVARALAVLADTMPESTDDARAIALLERAVAIVERTRGPDHPATAAMLTDLGNRQGAAGRHAQALAILQRTIRVAEDALGDHPYTAAALHNTARELHALGRHDEARSAWTRSIAMRQRWLGEEDPGLLPALHGLGTLELAAGRRAGARAAFEHGWRIVRAHELRTPVAGMIAWGLARSIDIDDPDRALALASDALVRLRDDGKPELVAEIHAWVRARST